MIPTPLTTHLSAKDFESVYEPAEDTFALLDASGSGVVSSFLSRICGPSAAVYICIDLNPFASLATLETGEINKTLLDPIVTDLCSSLTPRINGLVDVLLFNPPYVVTDDNEMAQAQSNGVLERAWAGGQAGMVVTNRVLDIVNDLLAPGGKFYLVAISQNKPLEIIEAMSRQHGLHGEVVLKRRAGREHLHILRFIKGIRFQSTQAPATKAASLLDALPGNSLVSKTGSAMLATALTGAAISSELFVLNEEVVILGSFVVFVGYVSTLVRGSYTEWANGQIQKTKDILNAARSQHTSAVQERIDTVGEMKDVEALTKSMFELSKQTAQLEHETFALKQQAALTSEIKSVLDAWVRHEAQVREAEQRDLVQTVVTNVQKQLGDKKLQRDILVSSVQEIENLVKAKAI
ncbi:atp4 subunit B of the stator stalk of mitochondrial F1F0 ATP synthase [Microbotryomycetes sp. JL221]|nr:atp4 subunit B of the stator stalk of mitochondrial F1F0 ATP synthase [Microbotryomycetes sp. JL221]